MIGYQFQPGSDNELRKRLNTQNGALGPMAQQALRILSLRLPSVVGGAPPAPSELLRQRIGGTGGGSAVLDSLGRTANAGFAPSGNEASGLVQMIQQALSSAPSPTIGFGDDPRAKLAESTAPDGLAIKARPGVSPYGRVR